MQMVSGKRLIQIAAYGGLGIGIFGVFAQYNIQNSVRNSLCYKEAFKYLCDHPEAQHQLGQPISGGRIDMRNKIGNDSKENKLRFTIPVKGSKSKGSMTYYVTKVDERERNYKVSRVELDVDHITDKTLLIKKESV